MNYLAHGLRHLDDPWSLAGTALPDWLRVLDRRARTSTETLATLVDDADPRAGSLARGALRHHEDDRRFHASAAFAETRRAVADAMRRALPAAAGHRPSFVAHLVVEVQIDALLAAGATGRVDAYYASLASLDAGEVEAVARRVAAPSSVDGLARLVRRFVSERFLADYLDDAATVRRLDRVVRSVRQPPLPAALADLLPAARACVASRLDELLGGSAPSGQGGGSYPDAGSIR
jgi:hypothetical protein